MLVLVIVSIIAGLFLGVVSNWIYDILRTKQILPSNPTVQRVVVIALACIPLIMLVALPETQWGGTKHSVPVVQTTAETLMLKKGNTDAAFGGSIRISITDIDPNSRTVGVIVSAAGYESYQTTMKGELSSFNYEANKKYEIALISLDSLEYYDEVTILVTDFSEIAEVNSISDLIEIPPTPLPDAIIFIDYIVQPNDSLETISLRLDTSSYLMLLEGVSQDDLNAGETIKLPIGNPAFCPGRRPYVVEESDTAFNISRILGISLDELKAINHLNDNFTIVAGQVLCVP